MAIFAFDGRESEIESKIESEMFCAYTLIELVVFVQSEIIRLRTTAKKVSL